MIYLYGYLVIVTVWNVYSWFTNPRAKAAMSFKAAYKTVDKDLWWDARLYIVVGFTLVIYVFVMYVILPVRGLVCKNYWLD